jgi:hypothetical protein
MHVPGLSADRDDLVAWYQQMFDEVCVHADPDQRGVLWNHLGIVRCMVSESLDTSRGWSLVVQDDARPLDGWEDHLPEVCWNAPAPFVSLGHFSNFGQRLVERGIPFGLGANVVWGQAVLYRHDVVRSYARLVEDVAEMDFERYRKWDDGLPSVHSLLHGTKSCFTARALFEHQDWDSTMGHVKGQWRHARATIGNTPLGPRWGGVPRHGGGGPGVEKVQRELAERLSKWRVR